MEYSPTLCFASLYKRNNPRNKSIKLTKAELSRHYLKRTNRSYVTTSIDMSQQRIEAELKLEVKNVVTFHNFVATQNERE